MYKMVELDSQFYSRQIATIGHEMMRKIMNMRVLIIGLRGVGIETAKNLVLTGPGSVVIHDDNTVEDRDLASNFYLIEEDVGNKTRAQACLEKLRKLNPFVKEVAMHHGEINEELLSKFDLVFLSEAENDHEIIRINEFCRSNGKGFILCELMGAFGFSFVDFGSDFTIFNLNGKECESRLISGISQSNPGRLTTFENNNFQAGDSVTLYGIQGMTELNGTTHEIDIDYETNEILIADTSSFSSYIKGGNIKEVKKPKQVSFKSYQEILNNPIKVNDFMSPNWKQLHIAYRAVREFQSKHSHLPRINDESNAQECVDLARSLNIEAQKNGHFYVDEISEETISLISRFCRAQISPMAMILGGIMAQEIVKYLGKYCPIMQCIYLDALDIIPKLANRDLRDSRYDDQIALLGNEFQDKLEDLRPFLIGSGAVGCEVLKGFAIMGVSCRNGLIHLTDFDMVEKSNLNRQFLFNEQSIGKPKATCAVEAVKKFNSKVNIDVKTQKVCVETEYIFTDFFWDDLDVVLMAVDNVIGRKYIDNKSSIHNLPLFNPGTEGVCASMYVFLPSSETRYNPPSRRTQNIPACTITSFPYKIEHCIEWSLAKFKSYFTEIPKIVSNILENWNEELYNTIQTDLLKEIRDSLLLIKQPTYINCVHRAIYKFEELYQTEIKKVKQAFPADSVDSEGKSIWSGARRVPNELALDSEDSNHLSFLQSCANLYAHSHRIKVDESISFEDLLCQENPCQIFRSEEYEDLTLEAVMTHETMLKEIESLRKSVIQDDLIMNSTEFEKDDETNFHVKFIHSSSSIRAHNYNIEQISEFDTQVIAGRIIPALASTNAMVSGFLLLELCKSVLGKDLSQHNAVINYNLASNIYLYIKGRLPKLLPKKEEDDQLVLNRSLSLGDLISEVRNRPYNLFMLSIDSINHGILYMEGDYYPENYYLMTIEDIYQDRVGVEHFRGKKKIVITARSSILEEKPIKIEYIFHHSR
jgi:ubiquitin-activating enzyme E1